MPKPLAAEPQDGQRFQLLGKCPGERSWESIDYAKDRPEKKHLDEEYHLAYRGMGWEFKWVEHPKKYWPPQPAPVRKEAGNA